MPGPNPTRRTARRGLSLIEMLMATAITLLMMAAIVTLFANLSGSVANRRALIEVSGQLRQVRQLLARDLAGCTVPPGPQGLTPWRQRPGEAIGYFEILEGDRSDSRPSRLVDGRIDAANGNFEIDYAGSLIPSGGDPQSLLPQQVGNRVVRANDITNGGGLGDADDVLALTVRALGEPFSAEVPGIGRVESTLAEVLWYAREIQPDDPNTTNVDESLVQQDDPNTPQDESIRGEPGMRTIYRRVLLIAPWLPAGPDYNGAISLHRGAAPNGSPIWIPNTLADLTRREYRYAHEYDLSRADLDYPHELDMRDVPNTFSREFAVLDNVLAFDVRVLDPGAPVYLVGAGTAVEPIDPGWPAAIAGNTPVSFGAYLDLGWDNAGRYDFTTVNGAPQPSFQQEHQLGWHPRFPGNFRGVPAVFDSWTWHYENDGLDQDDTTGNDNVLDGDPTTGMIDEGTNGRDDDIVNNTTIGWNGVDDVLERETSPPYAVPLRAVKVILRVYERDARQVREASVTNSFVP